jgi:hypothetical protein
MTSNSNVVATKVDSDFRGSMRSSSVYSEAGVTSDEWVDLEETDTETYYDMTSAAETESSEATTAAVSSSVKNQFLRTSTAR